jgi:hypothetical protein
MTRGLLDDVRITLLPGENWIPGPVSSTYAVNFVPERTVAASRSPSNQQAGKLIQRWRAGSLRSRIPSQLRRSASKQA